MTVKLSCAEVRNEERRAEQRKWERKALRERERVI